MTTQQRRWGTIILALLAAMTLATLAIQNPSAHADNDQPEPNNHQAGLVDQCKPNTLIDIPASLNSIPGVPEQVPQGVGSTRVAIGTQLRDPSFTVKTVAYNSHWELGFISYKQSRQMGIDQAKKLMADTHQQCPNTTFHLFGYSMGADAAANIVEDIAHNRGPIPQDKFGSAFLMANPSKTRDALHEGNASTISTGLIDPRNYGTLSDRTMEFCNAGDAVCDTSSFAGWVYSDQMKRLVTSNPALIPVHPDPNVVSDLAYVFRPDNVVKQTVDFPPAYAGWLIHSTTYSVPGNGVTRAQEFFVQHKA